MLLISLWIIDLLSVKFLSFCFVFRRVRAIYDCVAENNGELSFNKGAIISNGKLILVTSGSQKYVYNEAFKFLIVKFNHFLRIVFYTLLFY